MTVPENVTERRRHERYPLMMEPGVLIGGEVLGAVIIALSAGGAKLRLRQTEDHRSYDPGASIVLHIPNFGGFDGKIVWKDDDYVGLLFNEDHKTLVNLVLESARRQTSQVEPARKVSVFCLNESFLAIRWPSLFSYLVFLHLKAQHYADLEENDE